VFSVFLSLSLSLSLEILARLGNVCLCEAPVYVLGILYSQKAKTKEHFISLALILNNTGDQFTADKIWYLKEICPSCERMLNTKVCI
jgi:hypothetical protein